MEAMTVNERLTKAGVAVHISADQPPLSRRIPTIALLANQASRLASFGDLEDRISQHIKAASGPIGITPVLSATLRVSPHLSAVDILKQAIEINSDNACVARVMRLEEMRGTFFHLSGQGSTNDCFEGCFGLLGIGISLEESERLLTLYKTASDDDNQFGLLTAIIGSGHFMSLIERGQLETEIDESELLTALITVYENQNLEPLLDYMQQSHSWYKRICLYYMTGYLSTLFVTHEVLESLLELYSADDDSDAFIMAMYAIGQCVKYLGVEAALMVLEVARDDHGNGSNKQSLLINASYRARLDASEREAVIELVHNFDVDDSDCKRALGRVLDFFTDGLPQASNWFFRGGYGRGVDFYDPFAPHLGGYAPKLIQDIIIDPSREGLSTWVKTMKEMSLPNEIVALISANLLDLFPEMTSLYIRLLKDLNDSNKSGAAAALLTSVAEHRCSPVYLRCLLDDKDSGGPILETPSVIGELISYSSHYTTSKVANSLLTSLSPHGREMCAGFLRAQYTLTQDDDHAQLLFKIGHSLNISVEEELPLDLRLALGQSIDIQEVLTYIQEQDEAQALRYWSILLEQFNDPDRQSALALAREHEVWTKVPLELAQTQVLRMAKGGWVSREVSCVFLSTLGERSLEGGLGPKINIHVERLVNDGDSDVSREARRAAIALGIEAVIISAENIREGILNPKVQSNSDLNVDEVRQQWIERLFTMLNEENDRNEILTLCRMRDMWPHIDPQRLGQEWLQIAGKGWVARESMCVLACHYNELLNTPNAEEIRDRIIELCQDGDGDVEREAKGARHVLGL